MTNLERYRKDLDALISTGEQLDNALQLECHPDEFKAQAKRVLGDKGEAFLKSLPSFATDYQRWYSAAKALARQLLPDRLADFVRHYEKPKPRKDISFENYRIEDCLQGLWITRGFDKEKVVGPDAAIPHFRQQRAIVEAI